MAKPMKPFIHLNVHSEYSRGWGVGSVEALCLTAKELGIKQLALTDTNGLYGMIFFLAAAREAGITPILGSEILFDGRRAVLIVKNRDGYANLCRILSDRHCRRDFNLLETIRKWRHGLVIFSDDFNLLKVLKRDSTEDLYVEMSPGFQMGRCYAFPAGQAFLLLPPTVCILLQKTSTDSTVFCGRHLSTQNCLG